MKMPFPSAKCLLDHHSCFGMSVTVGFLRCTSCCCVQRHQEWAASVPTVPKKDAIVKGTMVVLQISANVTCTEHVTIMCTSWPAGNDIGEHSFKLNSISVEVRDPNIHIFFWFVFEFSRKTVARFVLAEISLCTHLHGCRHLAHLWNENLSCWHNYFCVVRALVIWRGFRQLIQLHKEIPREGKIRF